MAILSSSVKSYIAGFLDGDGCIMYQLIHRKDYRNGYQIRASIVFYQHTDKRAFLEWLHQLFGVGYVRNRGDDVSEYTIVGIDPVIEILKVLKPYVRLKREHIKLALKINKILSKPYTIQRFIKAAELVDKFAILNYSKKRTNTSKKFKSYLRQHKLYPRND
tara:strand:+ start:159 stop:644 length:486 start_codon:yes stop_codon:yes gene_type:complete